MISFKFEGADSPKCRSNSALISVGDKSLVRKYVFAARTSVFQYLETTKRNKFIKSQNHNRTYLKRSGNVGER